MTEPATFDDQSSHLNGNSAIQTSMIPGALQQLPSFYAEQVVKIRQW